jgi:RimJ/RimL family protein N-acetyltransferase
MTVTVRAAEPPDAGRLVELAQQVGAEPEGWLLTDGDWRSPGEERRHLRSLRRHSHAAVFVAEHDGAIVGRLSIARDLHPASEHVADVGVMVAREHRRLGAGTALMEAAERWAREAGVSKLELHVFPHNEAAIALYERLGYTREGLRRRHFRRGGRLIDAVLMAKDVS